MAKMRVTWRLIAVVGSAVCLAACGWGSSRKLDEQVASQVQRQQRESLGPAANDPRALPPYTQLEKLSPQDTATHPLTINPPAEQLPVGPASEAPATMPTTQPVAEQKYDLDQALAYAIGHAPSYRSQKEELFLATLSLLAEQHLWGPRFFNTITTSFSGVPEAGDHDQAFNAINNFRVAQRLPYGGELEVSALVNYVNELRSEVGKATDSQDSALRLSVSLPLLRGAGLAAREPLIQAQRNLVYAVREFEHFRREFLVEVATAYFELLRQQAAIVNQQRQLQNLQRLAERMEALALAGRRPYFEVQRAQQEALFARNSLLGAEVAYATAVDQFKILIGYPTPAPLQILPAELVVSPPALDVQAAITAALAFRLDLQNVADGVEDARRAVEVAKNNMLPDLDVFSSIGINGERNRQYQGIDLELEDSTYSAGMRLDVPLDRRQEQISLRRALINLERTRRNYSVERDRVVLRVRQNVRQIEQAQLALDLQRRNVELAERRRLGVRLQERNLGPRDVIEAEQDLLSARNGLDEAQRDLRVNILQFLLSTGQMRVSPQGQWLAPAQLIALQPGSERPVESGSAVPATQESVPATQESADA